MTARLLSLKTTLVLLVTTVALKVISNLTAGRKREMNNTALVQPIKKAKGAKAKASHHLKKRKAKASTITTDTLMMGGTPHPAMTDHGINQTIKNNGAELTKDHGPVTTKVKTQKVRAKVKDAASLVAIFLATTVKILVLYLIRKDL